MAFLDIRQINKQFGNTHVLHGIDLSIEEGEFVVFVGPSGCGKSTLLRVISGLEQSTSGSMAMAGRDITHAPPSQRDVAMVFQSYALYPHMTVEQNLSFGMRMRGVPKVTIDAKLSRAIEMLQLEPYLARKPAELSGGQCQRVAIGRALVQEPKLFLFDEPLSNLDAELRLRMRLEIGALHQELGKTMIYVTHDQVEAMTLADKIVVLRDGRVEQVGAPMALYANPANAFVASFIGSPAINMMDGSVLSVDAAGLAQVSVPGLAAGQSWACQLKPDTRLRTGYALRLGLRPEHWQLCNADDPQALSVSVRLIERLGAVCFTHVATVAGHKLCVSVPLDLAAQERNTQWIKPTPDWLHAFDEQGLNLGCDKLPLLHRSKKP